MFYFCIIIGINSVDNESQLSYSKLTELILKLCASSSGVRVGHGWATAQGAGYKGAPQASPYLRSLIKQNLYLLVNSLKRKNRYGGNTNLISLNKLLFHYILCLFSCGFKLQLEGAVEISPRALVVLKPALCVSLPSHVSVLQIQFHKLLWRIPRLKTRGKIPQKYFSKCKYGPVPWPTSSPNLIVFIRNICSLNQLFQEAPLKNPTD